MRILVTGGAGFIGSAFVRWTVQAHPSDEVIVFDKLTYAGNMANLAPIENHSGYRFVRGDITDQNAVREVMDGCDAVVNFAAETHVDRSILDGGDFVQTDVLGTWVLAEAARAARVARFVQISTDEVYGPVLVGESREGDPIVPTSPYAAAKAGGELLVLANYKTYGFPALLVRGANAYGPYQYPEKLIPLHVTNALQDQPLPVYGDGQQRRQWTYVDDFAAGVDVVLRHGEVGQVYNVGTPELDSELPVNVDLSRAILRLLGKSEGLLAPVLDRPAHDRRYRVDPGKLIALGWRPRWSWSSGLESTVRWYAENENWWLPLKSDTYRTYYERNYGDRSKLVRVGLA